MIDRGGGGGGHDLEIQLSSAAVTESSWQGPLESLFQYKIEWILQSAEVVTAILRLVSCEVKLWG